LGFAAAAEFEESKMVRSPAKKHHDEIPHDEVAADQTHDLHLKASPEVDGETSAEDANLLATVAMVGVVGIGVAVLEMALLPGVILGVAAMAAPKFAPKLGAALGPMFKSTVRGLYRISQNTRELVAETHEHVKDIVAEVDAEHSSAKETGAPLQ
jgi:hypothetical protein